MSEAGYGGLAHGKASMAEEKHPAPKHGIKHSHTEHHHDGSHSIKHTYHDGSETSHGAQDLAALQEHFGQVLQPEPQAAPMAEAGAAPAPVVQ